MNHHAYSNEILSALESKYSKDFEIENLSYEFDGKNGNYYRAVCKEPGSSSTFVVYYHLKGADYLLANDIGEDVGFSTDKPVLIDTYPNMLLNKAYARFLEENTDILFAIAEVHFISYNLSKEDVDQGLKHCLLDGSYEVMVKVYLFVDQTCENVVNFESELLECVSGYRILQQSIDVAYVSAEDMESVRFEYQNDTYLIRDRLKNDNRITRYSWYLTEAGKGIVNRKYVKGE